MSDKKKNIPTKNYKLISANIRLDQIQHEEEIQNELFNRKLKGFHLFCVILYGVFLIDGLIPTEQTNATITGIKVLRSHEVKVASSYKGVSSAKFIRTPTSVQIATTKGVFITNEITGFETKGTKVAILKTPLFKVSSMLLFKEKNVYVHRQVNFSGNFLFWPVTAFLISFICLVTKRFYGSTTLAVIAILNFVPFFLMVYNDKLY
jgi:hypothetical protein